MATVENCKDKLQGLCTNLLFLKGFFFGGGGGDWNRVKILDMVNCMMIYAVREKFSVEL